MYTRSKGLLNSPGSTRALTKRTVQVESPGYSSLSKSGFLSRRSRPDTVRDVEPITQPVQKKTTSSKTSVSKGFSRVNEELMAAEIQLNTMRSEHMDTLENLKEQLALATRAFATCKEVGDFEVLSEELKEEKIREIEQRNNENFAKLNQVREGYLQLDMQFLQLHTKSNQVHKELAILKSAKPKEDNTKTFLSAEEMENACLKEAVNQLEKIYGKVEAMDNERENVLRQHNLRKVQFDSASIENTRLKEENNTLIADLLRLEQKSIEAHSCSKKKKDTTALLTEMQIQNADLIKENIALKTELVKHKKQLERSEVRGLLTKENKRTKEVVLKEDLEILTRQAAILKNFVSSLMNSNGMLKSVKL
eukprot:TRINITY_DN1518_c0_g1_i11.p1 TRINITY_DN1518_c0_g1~~TRINITY_DN1518_c0_g1_i11.p1  ORF type:complete len:365 (+),score=92.76 TRINITY_DN1518_c0_g1_i11:175-1269(+)